MTKLLGGPSDRADPCAWADVNLLMVCVLLLLWQALSVLSWWEHGLLQRWSEWSAGSHMCGWVGVCVGVCVWVFQRRRGIFGSIAVLPVLPEVAKCRFNNSSHVQMLLWATDTSQVIIQFVCLGVHVGPFFASKVREQRHGSLPNANLGLKSQLDQTSNFHFVFSREHFKNLPNIPVQLTETHTKIIRLSFLFMASEKMCQINSDFSFRNHNRLLGNFKI